MESESKLVEGAMFHINHIVYIAHVVNKMSIAISDEVETFEIRELLEDFLFGDAEIDFQSVGSEVWRHEAQLAHQRGCTLVDMCRHKETTYAVHLVKDAVDIHIDGVEQVVLLLAQISSFSSTMSW